MSSVLNILLRKKKGNSKMSECTISESKAGKYLTFSLASAGLWILIILFYWFISRYEEKVLLDLFGPDFEAYRKKVPMLFPLLK